MADAKNNQQGSRETVRTGDTPLSAVTNQAGSSAQGNQNKTDVPEKYKYMDEP